MWELSLTNSTEGDSAKSDSKSSKTNQDNILFKDPKEYEHMTPEERKAETDRLKRTIKGMSLLPGA